MGEPRIVIRCYLANGDFMDYFSDECDTREGFEHCVEVECMSMTEWFEEDCYATDDPVEEEECIEMLDEYGVYD